MPEVIFTGGLGNRVTFEMLFGGGANFYNMSGVGTAIGIFPSGAIGAISGYSVINDYDNLVSSSGLISWKDRTVDIASVTKANKLITFTTNIKAAIGTGVAAEFLLMGTISDLGSSSAWFTKGTITGLGGGGDLEMPDINIVAGQDYQVNSLVIEMVADFTY